MRHAATLKMMELADTIPNYGRAGLIEDIVEIEKQNIYFTMKDIAKRFATTERTVRMWKTAGLLVPTQNIKGMVRFSLEDIELFKSKTRKIEKCKN